MAFLWHELNELFYWFKGISRVIEQVGCPIWINIIEFKREQNNTHDQYDVAGFAKLTGTLAPNIVGHIPCESSR